MSKKLAIGVLNYVPVDYPELADQRWNFYKTWACASDIDRDDFDVIMFTMNAQQRNRDLFSNKRNIIYLENPPLSEYIGRLSIDRYAYEHGYERVLFVDDDEAVKPEFFDKDGEMDAIISQKVAMLCKSRNPLFNDEECLKLLNSEWIELENKQWCLTIPKGFKIWTMPLDKWYIPHYFILRCGLMAPPGELSRMMCSALNIMPEIRNEMLGYLRQEYDRIFYMYLVEKYGGYVYPLKKLSNKFGVTLVRPTKSRGIKSETIYYTENPTPERDQSLFEDMCKFIREYEPFSQY